MKCLSCDSILSDEEAVRKYRLINEYIELCNGCLSYIQEDLDIYLGEADDAELENDDQ